MMMNTRIAILVAAGVLAGCASRTVETPVAPPPAAAPQVDRVETPHSHSAASTIDGYKRDIAQRIARMNSARVYAGRPQALLRSVVVLRYVVDERGQLLRSEILRSNRDRETESTALTTLRNSAPFPRPASHLLRHGRMEIAETWLFNNDGRFQLRSIAEAQMDR